MSIPFNKLISQIEYKSKLIGIDVLTVNEAYTSKCSFLDNEKICKHTKYLGKRISRGLFKASNGTNINADVNAAYNIMNGFKTDFQAIMTGLFLIIFAIVLLKAISLFCKYHNKIPISSNRLTPEEVMVKIHKVDTSDGGEPLPQVHKTDLEENKLYVPAGTIT